MLKSTCIEDREFLYSGVISIIVEIRAWDGILQEWLLLASM